MSANLVKRLAAHCPIASAAPRKQLGPGHTIARNVVGLVRNRAHELRAEVDSAVLELNLLGDGHTILGDARGTVGLVQDHRAALPEDACTQS